MKALFLVHNLPERGSYFRALEIARRLAARGHEVDLVFLSETQKHKPRVVEDAPTGSGGRIRRVETGYRAFLNERQEGWGLFDNAVRARMAWSGGYDFVYGFSHKPDCLFPAVIGRWRGAKVCMDWSDWWGGPEGLYQSCVLPSAPFHSLPRPIRWFRRGTFVADSFLESRAYHRAHAVSLISEEFLHHPGAPRDLAGRSIILHSGAPLEAIRPGDKTAARGALGLVVPPGTAVLGYIANFHTDEDLLLRALAAVSGDHPNTMLVVVGSDFERTTPELHEAVRGRVVHLGRRPFTDMATCLAASDILLLPLSDRLLNRARYPHKLSDYVAAGRPIVACDVGETGRIFRRFGLGEPSRPDAGSFAAAIGSVLADPGSWNSRGSEVRRVAEAEFDWDILAERLFGFLQKRTGLTF